MSIEEVIINHLLSQSGLTTLISNRIHFDELDQGTEFPAVVVTKISDNKIHTLTGQLQLERPNFQFSVVAKTKASARSVSDQIKNALIDFQGVLSEVEIQKIEMINEISGIEVIGAAKNDTVRFYTEDLEFEIIYVKE